jgi:hypothetical protein
MNRSHPSVCAPYWNGVVHVRRDDGPLHPELLYWHAIAGYFRGNHDGEFRDGVWGELLRRYPDSIWAHRVPEFLAQVGSAAPKRPGNGT